jgi:hypothetical protein
LVTATEKQNNLQKTRRQLRLSFEVFVSIMTPAGQDFIEADTVLKRGAPQIKFGMC